MLKYSVESDDGDSGFCNLRTDDLEEARRVAESVVQDVNLKNVYIRRWTDGNTIYYRIAGKNGSRRWTVPSAEECIDPKKLETLNRLAALQHQYPKRSPEQVATALLQGWAFTGQSREDHDREKAYLAERIREIRSK